MSPLKFQKTLDSALVVEGYFDPHLYRLGALNSILLKIEKCTVDVFLKLKKALDKHSSNQKW